MGYKVQSLVVVIIILLTSYLLRNCNESFFTYLVIGTGILLHYMQAISVAERVADERCEPSPGSDGSVVGYQVRLDSARCSFASASFCF